MAVSQRGRAIASQTIATDTTTAGEKFAVNGTTTAIIALIKVSSRTDGTFTLKIQHSHDGSNWEDYKAASGLSTDDTVYLTATEDADGPFFGLVRIVVVSASTTSGATVEADVYYN